jgi:hypothetical protein
MNESNTTSATSVGSLSPGGARRVLENGQIVNQADLDNDALGGQGFDYITVTGTNVTVTSGLCWKALYTLTTTVITSVVAATSATIGGTTFSTVSIVADRTVKGKFTTIQIASGTLIAYKGTI